MASRSPAAGGFFLIAPIVAGFFYGLTTGEAMAWTFIGLLVGLDANPGTAWFAVIELGLPTFVAGCFLGFFGGLLWQWGRERSRGGRLLP